MCIKLNDEVNGPPRLSICRQRAVHKRKIRKIVMNTKTKFDFNCKVLTLFAFYALPSGGKSKGAVVHSVDLSIKAHQLIKTFPYKQTFL